jgi:LPXTG-motif cell wall-anchored protein
MKGYLRAGLIALASVPIALTANGCAASASVADEPAQVALVHTITDRTPPVSPMPSQSVSQWPSTPASASASTISNLLPERPRTNLTAVVDPIAVPVHDGVQIRIGARNSGPLPITAPADQPAVTLSLGIDMCCALFAFVKSLGGCPIVYRYPPKWPAFPEEPERYDCTSTHTLQVGQTYWQSFVFPYISDLASGVWVAVSGNAQDPNDRDDRRGVVVRLAKPGSSLPVTGAGTVNIAGAGLALIIAGTMAIWYGRRKYLVVGGH